MEDDVNCLQSDQSPYSRIGKRALDIILAATMLASTAPILVGVSAALVTLDGRPVLYKQRRVGRHGQTFTILKFRTMKVGTDSWDAGYPDKDALTRLGRILRRYSLDELPQLWNVLVGDMSLVGPRPALLEQVDRYNAVQRQRLSVRPGLTGLAQIRHRNNATWTERIATDIEYLDTLSFRRDFTIMLLTIPNVLHGANVVQGQASEDVDDLPRP